MKNISKALTFRASSIGDCLMGKYLLENVHATFPDAKCAIVVANHGDMIRDVCKAYPWLKVIEANRRSPRVLSRLWKDFRGSDLVVTQYAGKKGGKFAFASKLAARMLAKRGGLIGFADASNVNGLLYDTLIEFSKSAPPASLEREALRAVGISVKHEWPTLQYVPMPSVLERFNLVAGEYIVVHLFSGNKSRGLHPDKKRELLTGLRAAFLDRTLVVSGGRGDKKEALEITKDLPVLVIAGETTLQEFMNLIAGSRGVVSIDTGVAHMTAQLSKPLVVLVGCLGFHWWQEGQYAPDAPISVFSRADLCENGHIAKDYSDCIGEISIPEVVYTAGKMLS